MAEHEKKEKEAGMGKRILPGTSSVFASLGLIPIEYAGDDSCIFLSAFSTSYVPGAAKNKNSCKSWSCVSACSNYIYSIFI